MESDWSDLVQTRLPGMPSRGASAVPATAIAFDTYHGLVWAGNDSGRLTSYVIKGNLQRYSSFILRSSDAPLIRQIVSSPVGVLALSKHQLSMVTRGGRTIWSTSSDLFTDLRCAIVLKKQSSSHQTPGQYVDDDDLEILAAGCQDQMFRIHIRDGSIVEQIPSARYTVFRNGGRYVCAASDTGSVHILNSRTLSLVHEWKPASECIHDMDANSEYLVTCGYSSRPGQPVVFDPLAYVFDLRQLCPLSSIPFQIGACHVRLHPRMSSTGILVSKNGHMQTIDVMNPLSIMVRHSALYDAQLTSMDLSATGEALAFADDVGTLHLWASPSKVGYIDFGIVEFAPPSDAPHLDWSLTSSLASIPLPYYYNVLASAWPPELMHEVGAPPTAIDPEILMRLQRSEIGFWAPNPFKSRPNQVANPRNVDESHLVSLKFLSEKARSGDDSDSTSINISDHSLDSRAGCVVPVAYQNVEIKYSKFGVDDFDFGFFNKTAYSGLETDITNSYANSLLQLYKFTPVIRNLALEHTATSCLRDDCLLCELGFLIDMLEKASGANCQATNFLKVFSGLPHVSTLGLLDDSGHVSAPSSMIQPFNRFLSENISADYRTCSTSGAMDKAIVASSTVRMRCLTCNNEVRRSETTSAHDLSYPFKVQGAGFQPTFSQVLMNTFEKRDNSRGWCNECRRYQQVSNREAVRKLPLALLLNTAISSADIKRLWVTENWVPTEIGISYEYGKMHCYQGSDLAFHLELRRSEITVYELVGIVAEIHNELSRKDHLVSLINVGISSPTPLKSADQWYLFNDFLVQKVPKKNALHFDSAWKLPAALSFQAKSHSHLIDNSWKTKLDLSPLYDPGSITRSASSSARPLSPSELPYSGMTVSMDSEFVCVQDEEYIIRCGGPRETVRPARLALGRLSVLRGCGPDACVPLIDDYVAASEPVCDHLTAYSGISPGDLDWNSSPYRLVTLKSAYKKLWLLLNMGCIFVGHGLLKDFRTINIHVPAAQVVDTVNLFFLKQWGGRKLSLRFLAWLLLQQEIQTGMHDSIEDARTAFFLWNKYQDYVDSGTLGEQLEWIYTRGRDVGWRAPSGSSPSNRSDSSSQKQKPVSKRLLGSPISSPPVRKL